MKSKYKRLGDYIIESKARNEGLKAETLLGINIDKFFMPSVANVIGTDMSVYKTVKRNQFACNRMHVGRDYRLPISMSRIDKEFIVSPAYDVFEIRDTDVLDPEYLMMWFSRSEFDRNAWFYTDADVRGGLHWKAFCDMQLPIPSIEKQRQIVAEYNVIQNRIALNQQLIKKLEETAQALYKQWFVDFEFPDKNGKPYKSSGGEMVESELGSIPKGWRIGTISELVTNTLGGDWGKEQNEGNYSAKVKCIRGTDIPLATYCMNGNLPTRFVIPKNLLSRKLKASDIVIEISGGSPTQSTGRSVLITKEFLEYMNSDLICSNFCRVISSNESHSFFLHSLINHLYNNGVFFAYENSTNGVKNLDLSSLFVEEKVILPEEHVMKYFQKIIEILISDTNKIGKELDLLKDIHNLLLSKLATVEN